MNDDISLTVIENLKYKLGHQIYYIYQFTHVLSHSCLSCQTVSNSPGTRRISKHFPSTFWAHSYRFSSTPWYYQTHCTYISIVPLFTFFQFSSGSSKNPSYTPFQDITHEQGTQMKKFTKHFLYHQIHTTTSFTK